MNSISVKQLNLKLQVYLNNLKITMAKNLTKRNIVLAIHEKIHEKYNEIAQNQIQEIVQLTMETIANALKEGRNVELRNFGVFEVQHRKSRIGRNPNRPEKDVIIPAHMVIKFKAGKNLKEKMKALDLNTAGLSK